MRSFARPIRACLTLAAALCVAGLTFAAPTPDDPFRPDVAYAEGAVTATFVLLQPGQHIYDAMLTCSLGAPTAKPPLSGRDEMGGDYYSGLAAFTWAAAPGQTFTLGYQGCDASMCHMPQELTLSITADGRVVAGALPAPAPTPAAPAAEAPAPEPAPTPAATVPGTERSRAGFIPPEDFVAFLRGDQAAAAEPTFLDDPQAWVAANGVWLLILVVFLGGLLLNLTPCVLPMIPINLAIIGAGAAGGSRLRGALRGGAYGLGIALAYGVLALIPALTGTAFGAIQSAWWFNAAIAIVFVLLALALFDVFMIDFTRFAGPGSGKKGAIAAFVAGAVSAVLAGACVAPVLLAVLLLTADGVATGAWWMLCLPFVLGLGMAAPWPIAGAGLSFLPKPGAWMMWVKKVFGVIVLLFAAYYAWVAYRSLAPADAPAEEAGVVNLDGADLPAVEAAIAQARAQGKPVFIDFWGTACKACDEMEAETFPDPAVRAELARFAFLKVRMDLSDRAIRPTQERFAVKGLPTYVIIE